MITTTQRTTTTTTTTTPTTTTTLVALGDGDPFLGPINTEIDTRRSVDLLYMSPVSTFSFQHILFYRDVELFDTLGLNPKSNAQYILPTPTRLNCRVGGIRTEFATCDSLDES